MNEGTKEVHEPEKCRKKEMDSIKAELWFFQLTTLLCFLYCLLNQECGIPLNRLERLSSAHDRRLLLLPSKLSSSKVNGIYRYWRRDGKRWVFNPSAPVNQGFHISDWWRPLQGLRRWVEMFRCSSFPSTHRLPTLNWVVLPPQPRWGNWVADFTKLEK